MWHLCVFATTLKILRYGDASRGKIGHGFELPKFGYEQERVTDVCEVLWEVDCTHHTIAKQGVHPLLPEEFKSLKKQSDRIF